MINVVVLNLHKEERLIKLLEEKGKGGLGFWKKNNWASIF